MESTHPHEIDPPATVLLLAAARDETPACDHLCATASNRAELRVSFASDGANRGPTADRPAKLGLVSVGDVLRSAAGSAGGPDFSGPVAVDTVEDPGDLAAIGRTVSRFCEEWSADPEQLTICFRSLDALLRNAPAKTVFRFCHVLNERLERVDAHAHVHLDPSLHPDEVVATFGTIYDAVVVDESVTTEVPEATDEDVARTLDAWSEDVEPSPWRPDRPLTEATDEEVQQVLENV